MPHILRCVPDILTRAAYFRCVPDILTCVLDIFSPGVSKGMRLDLTYACLIIDDMHSPKNRRHLGFLSASFNDAAKFLDVIASATNEHFALVDRY